MKKYIGLFAIVILIGALWFFWPQLLGSDRDMSLELQITTSSYPLEYVAQQIGGARVKVHNVVPLGVEPHEFEPSPSSLADIHKSTIFLFNGVGLDPWAEKMQNELADKGVVAMKATAGIRLLNADSESTSGELGLDPHFWLDADNMVLVAERLTKVLIQIDSDGASGYKDNFVSFKAKMESLDTSYKSTLGRCQSKQIVVSHNFFAYPAEKYGLKVTSISGVSPETEPSPKELAEIVDTVRETGVRYIFAETLTSQKIAETLAVETGTEILVLNPLEGLTEEEVDSGADYESVMQYNLSQLVKALGCN